MDAKIVSEATQMIAIPLENLLPGVEKKVNFYIRLDSDRYLLVSRAGNSDQRTTLSVIRDKKVDTIYIRRTDYDVYMGMGIFLTKAAVNRPDISVAQKTVFLKQSLHSVTEELIHIRPSKEVYEHAQEMAQATLKIVAEEPDLHMLLSSLHLNHDGLLTHSLAVSLIGVMIAQKMGWTKTDTLERLSLGGLVHDIGKKDIPEELLNKDPDEMSVEEYALYESHPFRGVTLLSKVRAVAGDVLDIVYEHHENSLGTGFPRKLRDLRTNPLSRVIALADEFVRLTLPLSPKKARRSPEEALKRIELDMGQPFQKEAFRALKKVVNTEKP